MAAGTDALSDVPDRRWGAGNQQSHLHPGSRQRLCAQEPKRRKGGSNLPYPTLPTLPHPARFFGDHCTVGRGGAELWARKNCA